MTFFLQVGRFCLPQVRHTGWSTGTSKAHNLERTTPFHSRMAGQPSFDSILCNWGESSSHFRTLSSRFVRADAACIRIHRKKHILLPLSALSYSSQLYSVTLSHTSRKTMAVSELPSLTALIRIAVTGAVSLLCNLVAGWPCAGQAVSCQCSHKTYHHISALIMYYLCAYSLNAVLSKSTYLRQSWAAFASCRLHCTSDRRTRI